MSCLLYREPVLYVAYNRCGVIIGALVVLLLSCFFIPPAIAQKPVFSTSYYKHYTSEDGLPQNSVKSIAQDNYGFIWLATELGLVRYNGTSFRIYNKLNSDIPTSRVYDLVKKGDSLLALRNGEERLFCIKDGKAKNTVSRNNWKDFNYWAFELNMYGTSNSFLIYEHPEYLETFTFYIKLNAQEHVEISKYKNIEWKYKDSTVKVYSLPYGNSKVMKGFFSLNESLYYIDELNISNCMLTKYTMKGVKSVRVKGIQPVTAAHKKSDLRIAINNVSTDIFLLYNSQVYQLVEVDSSTVEAVLLLDDYNYIEKNICSILYDKKEETLYLGSFTNGLYKHKKQYFYSRIYDTSYTNYNNYYNQVAYDDSTILTTNGVLFSSNLDVAPQLYDKKSRTQRPYYNYIYNNSAEFILDNQSVFGNDIGKVFNDFLRVRNYPVVTAYTTDKDGNLLLAVCLHGILRLSRSGYATGYKIEKLFTLEQCVHVIEFENDSTLWIGLEGGLYKGNLNTGIAIKDLNFEDKVVRSIYIRGKDEIWLCSYEGGLSLYYKGKFIAFPKGHHLHLNTIHKILEDANGYFWMSTNNGIYVASRDELIQYLSDGSGLPYFYYLGAETGILTAEFNGGNNNVGVALKNGYFTFSTINGIVFFRPGPHLLETPKSPIVFDKIEVDGHMLVTEDSLVSLPTDFKRINIELNTFYTGNRENLLFEYKLLGEKEESDWIKVLNNTVSFNSLPIGTTEIIVRCRAGFGNENYNYKKLIFIRKAAWWQNKWMFLGYIFIAALIVRAIVKIRIYRLRKKNQELNNRVIERTESLKKVIETLEQSENNLNRQLRIQTKVNRNIVHDILTPLKYLTILSKKNKQLLLDSRALNYDDMDAISTSSERIYKYTQNLSDYLKALQQSRNDSVKSIDLYKLVEAKIALFEPAANLMQLNCLNLLPQQSSVQTYEQILDIVLNNILDNAVKNAIPATSIRVQLNTESKFAKQYTIIDIENYSHYIDPDILNNYNTYLNVQTIMSNVYIGFGFELIKDLLPTLQAKVTLSQRSENDYYITTVSLFLKHIE